MGKINALSTSSRLWYDHRVILGKRTVGQLQTLLDGDCAFDLFCSSREEDIARVLKGFVPVLVTQEEPERLVWGFSAVRSAITAGGGATFAVHAMEGDPASFLEAALRMEGRTDHYSWRERRAIVELSDRFDIHLFGAVLRLISTEGDVVSAIRRFTALPSAVAASVNDGLIDLRTGELCAEIQPIAFGALISAAATASFSRRKKLLVSFCEFASGNALSGSDQERVALEVTSSGDPETKMRLERYPALTALEERFREFQNQYCRGKGIRIEAAPGYEGDQLYASFAFRSRSEFRARVDALQDAEEGINGILDLLF